MKGARTTMYGTTALVLACMGCGAEGESTIPVYGRITFDGGPCPAEGTIAFSPISVEEGVPRRPGTAEFKQDGKFQATSFRPGDGLLPGTYRALISCWTGEPSNKDPSSYERLNCVPRDYIPEEIVVDRSAEEIEITIDVPPKK
jgi:hypothetical protein